jgi:hypothetical protein
MSSHHHLVLIPKLLSLSTRVLIHLLLLHLTEVLLWDECLPMDQIQTHRTTIQLLPLQGPNNPNPQSS